MKEKMTIEVINETLIKINRTLIVMSLPESERKAQRDYFTLLEQKLTLEKVLKYERDQDDKKVYSQCLSQINDKILELEKSNINLILE